MTIDLERLAVDADYWDEVAPEGATHFMHTEKFVKWVFGVEWVFYASSGREWKKTHCNWMLKQYLNDGTFVLAKPSKIAAPEWDGTGLPPVGCECKAVWLEAPDGGSREYEPVLVKGYFKSEVLQVWFCTQQGEDIVCRMNNCSFWTIRSHAERDREDLAEVLGNCVKMRTTFGEMADVIIAAGWCKEGLS
jgi:hypothetical protein